MLPLLRLLSVFVRGRRGGEGAELVPGRKGDDEFGRWFSPIHSYGGSIRG